jgi:hypothetical protein
MPRRPGKASAKNRSGGGLQLKNEEETLHQWWRQEHYSEVCEERREALGIPKRIEDVGDYLYGDLHGAVAGSAWHQ